MTKKHTKTIQTALWAALVLLQMAVVGCLEVHAEQEEARIEAAQAEAKPVQEETEAEVEPVQDKAEAKAEPVQAEVVETEEAGVSVQADSTKIRREVTYEAIEGEADLPAMIDVSVLAGNEEEIVACRAVGQWEEKAYWRDDFSFPLTFYEYGADAYQLEEMMLKKVMLNEDDLSELVWQYGDELLASMELSPEEYEITALHWASDPYMNADGTMCRDAVGSGNRLLRDYKVAYEGYVDPQRWKALKAAVQGEEEAELPPDIVEPETESETVSEAEKLVQIEEESAETEQKKSKLQEFLEKVTKILLIAVGIGAIFFFGGLLVLALLWVVRKMRERILSLQRRKKNRRTRKKT